MTYSKAQHIRDLIELGLDDETIMDRTESSKHYVAYIRRGRILCGTGARDLRGARWLASRRSLELRRAYVDALKAKFQRQAREKSAC